MRRMIVPAFGYKSPANIDLFYHAKPAWYEAAEPCDVARRVRVAGDNAGAEDGEPLEADSLDSCLLEPHDSYIAKPASRIATDGGEQRETGDTARMAATGKAANDADFQGLQLFFGPLHAAGTNAHARGTTNRIA